MYKRTNENAGHFCPALSCSLKNEGYKYEPLCRFILRRVEQYTLTVAVPSFEYGYIKQQYYENCVNLS